MNLNEDDEESESELVLLNNNKKKIKSKSNHKKSVYNFDEYDDQINNNDQIAKMKSTTSLNGGEISNTIPPNQPVCRNSFNQSLKF